MPLPLRLLLIIGSFVFFLFLIKMIHKSKISTDFATVWILIGLFILLIAIFPEIVYFTARLLKVDSPANAVYLFMITLLLILVFYLFTKVSILQHRINELVQKVSIDKKDKEA